MVIIMTEIDMRHALTAEAQNRFTEILTMKMRNRLAETGRCRKLSFAAAAASGNGFYLPCLSLVYR